MTSRRRPQGRGRKRRQSEPVLPGPGVATGLFLLRLYTGCFFLVVAWWKLISPEASIGEMIADFREFDYVPMVERAVAMPPVILGYRLDTFAAFLREVMLPSAAVIAPVILVFEALLGLALLLGLGVRLMASLGFLMMLAFSLAKPHPGVAQDAAVGVRLFTVHSSNWPITFVLLALALGAAGRVLGLDRWLWARGPRWLRWVA